MSDFSRFSQSNAGSSHSSELVNTARDATITTYMPQLAVQHHAFLATYQV
jgi:hypothetical protein